MHSRTIAIERVARSDSKLSQFCGCHSVGICQHSHDGLLANAWQARRSAHTAACLMRTADAPADCRRGTLAGASHGALWPLTNNATVCFIRRNTAASWWARWWAAGNGRMKYARNEIVLHFSVALTAPRPRHPPMHIAPTPTRLPPASPLGAQAPSMTESLSGACRHTQCSGGAQE